MMGRTENEGRRTGMDFLMPRGSGQNVLWAARLDAVTDCSSVEEELQNSNQRKQQAEEERPVPVIW